MINVKDVEKRIDIFGMKLTHLEESVKEFHKKSGFKVGSKNNEIYIQNSSNIPRSADIVFIISTLRSFISDGQQANFYALRNEISNYYKNKGCEIKVNQLKKYKKTWKKILSYNNIKININDKEFEKNEEVFLLLTNGLWLHNDYDLTEIIKIIKKNIILYNTVSVFIAKFALSVNDFLKIFEEEIIRNFKNDLESEKNE